MHPPEPERISSIMSLQTKLAQDAFLSHIDFLGEIVVLFRTGKTLREIAELKFSEHEVEVAKEVVRTIVTTLLEPWEYEKLAKWRWARSQMKSWVWIHGQNSQTKSQAGKDGAKKSWGHIYEEVELQRLQELLWQEEYRYWTRINASKIAQVLNEEFHESISVRTSENVRQQISRLKKKTQSRTDGTLS